jgi:hypothetical protein
MFTFQLNDKRYKGMSALDIVRALESDAAPYPHQGQSIRKFLRWSLAHQCDRIPPRDLDLSDSLEDDALALSYLYLRDEYGAGRLFTEKNDRKRSPSL